MYTQKLPSGRVRGIFRTPAGKRVGKTFDYAYEAEAWATEAEARAFAAVQQVATTPTTRDVEVVAETQTRPDGPTVVAHGTAWVDRRRGSLSKATTNFYAAQVRGIATTDLGAVPIDQPRKSHVEAWITAQVDAGVPRPTVNARLKVLRMVCQDALAEGLTDRDPTVGLKYLSTDIRPERVLTKDEDLALIGAATPDLAAMVLLALDAGLRWEEAAGLGADCFQGDFIIVRQVIERDTRRVRRFTKSGKARAVPMTPRLVAALAPIRLKAEAHGGLLFTSPEGDPLDYFNWRRRTWRPAARVLKPRPRFHDLRHTYGTRLSAAGVQRREIAELMGHADEKTTARYIHAGTDGHRMALVQAALAG